MTGTSINLKSALRCIDYIREHIDALEERITDALGPEATSIDTDTDFERLAKQKPGSLFGPHMSAELLRGLWKKDIIYHWTYRDHQFDVSPIKDASEKGFYLVGPDGVNSFVTFAQCVCDAVDYDEMIWDMMEAKVVGFADGCLGALKHVKDLNEPVRTPDGRVSPSVAKAPKAFDQCNGTSTEVNNRYITP